jgi:hypothetical protein
MRSLREPAAEEDLGGMSGWWIDKEPPFMSTVAPPPDPPGELPDLERSDRILDKLGPLWRRVPHWNLAWLIVNLVPAGLKASDAEIEVELDRLLDLNPG